MTQEIKISLTLFIMILVTLNLGRLVGDLLICKGNFMIKQSTSIKYSNALRAGYFHRGQPNISLFANFDQDANYGFIRKEPLYPISVFSKYYIEDTGIVPRFSKLEKIIDSVFKEVNKIKIQNPYE